MRMSDEQVEPDRLGPPCLGVGARSSRRVTAKGFSPEAYGACQITPSDLPTPRGWGRGYSLTAIASGSIRPQNATSEFRCQFPAGDEEFRCQTIGKSTRSNVLTI